jgi:signal transduction histidine kinase
LERVHPEDRERTRETIKRAFREARPFAFEERIVRPDGEVRVLQSQGQWDSDQTGRPIRLMGTCQDVTARKRTEQQLLEANAALQALSARLINAQEEERTRIARELHDDFSQQIAAVSIALSNLKRGIPAELADLRVQSERIQQKTVHLAEAVRRLSHELHPAVLQHAGLAAALSRYCSELRELTGIRISVHTYGSFTGLPEPVALVIYRVAQEALQNVVRHAGVNEAAVSLGLSGDALRLVVSDRGVGMASGREGGNGLGLVSMRERARLVDGSIELESRPGRGTSLTLTVPRTWTEPISGGG